MTLEVPGLLQLPFPIGRISSVVVVLYGSSSVKLTISYILIHTCIYLNNSQESYLVICVKHIIKLRTDINYTNIAEKNTFNIHVVGENRHVECAL